MANQKIKHLKFFGIGRITPYLSKLKKLIAAMVFFGLTGSLTDIILPLFQRYALDHYVGLGVFDTVAIFVVLYLLTILVAAVSNYISCALAIIIEMRTNQELRQLGFNHLQTLSFSYFNQNSVGYIHARLMSDTSRIGSLVSWTLVDCVWRFSYLIGAIVVMIVLNPKLAAMVLSILPLLTVLYAIFQKRLIGVNREVREINSQITSNFNEGITGAKTIKSLGIEEKIESRFTEETQNMRKKSVQASRLRGLFAGTMNLASSVALAIVLWKGGYIATEELGTFSVFMSYAQGMMEPLRWLVDIISDLITTQVNIERFVFVLAGIQFVIIAVKLQQLRVGTLLHNPAIFDYQDHVGVPYGRKSVGDHQAGSACGNTFQCRLDFCFCERVHGSRGLVQYQDLRICQNGSRKRNQLLLAGGEQVPAFSHICVQTLFQVRDYIFGGNGTDCLPNLILCCIGIAHQQVFPHCAGKQVRCLQHISDGRMEPKLATLPRIPAVDQHLTLSGFIEPAYQVDQGGFSRTGFANNGQV